LLESRHCIGNQRTRLEGESFVWPTASSRKRSDLSRCSRLNRMAIPDRHCGGYDDGDDDAVVEEGERANDGGDFD